MRAIRAGAALVILAVSACTSGSSSKPGTVSPSSSASIRSPSAFPSPVTLSRSQAPVAYGPTTLVAGASTCSIDLGTITTDPDGTGHSRDGLTACTVVANDPRVSGDQVDQSKLDHWGAADSGALVQWGTSRLQNAGGTWEGRFTGIYTLETSDIITYWYTGTGGYAGLSYHMWLTEPGTAMTWPIHGMIFPGKPPTP